MRKSINSVLSWLRGLAVAFMEYKVPVVHKGETTKEERERVAGENFRNALMDASMQHIVGEISQREFLAKKRIIEGRFRSEL